MHPDNHSGTTENMSPLFSLFGRLISKSVASESKGINRMFCFYLCVTREGSIERGAMIIGHRLLWDVGRISVYIMSFPFFYLSFNSGFGRQGNLMSVTHITGDN
jgi:hypothetical protein